MSEVEAEIVGSEPNLTNTNAFAEFVTTTESPPPVNNTLTDTLPTGTPTVPVGRKGLTEPSGMEIVRFCQL